MKQAFESYGEVSALDARPPVNKINDITQARASLERGDWDLTRLYKTEAAQLPLLDKDGEVELAQAIDAANQAQEELLQVRLSGQRVRPSELGKLEDTIKSGHEAKKLFIASNLLLVMSVAKKYHRKTAHLEMADLIQEGNFGLIKAVDHFDWRKGFKFSTYATWWIRREIKRAIEGKDRTISVPNWIHHSTRDYQYFRNLLHGQLGRNPSDEEIISKMSDSHPSIDNIKKSMATEDVYSLDKSLVESDNFSGDLTLADLISQNSFEQPEDYAESHKADDIVKALLTILDPLMAKIIVMRYGLDGRPPATRSDISGATGIREVSLSAYSRRALIILQHPAFHKTFRTIFPNYEPVDEWQDEALCLGEPVQSIMPNRDKAATEKENKWFKENKDKMKSRCNECPVAKQCGELVLKLEPDKGLWAGEFYSQNRKTNRALLKSQKRKLDIIDTKAA